MSITRPIGATAQWLRIVERARHTCECQGECGGVKRRHPVTKVGKRLETKCTGGAWPHTLHVVPRDPETNDQAAASLLDNQLAAYCADCADSFAVKRRQAARSLATQARDEMLAGSEMFPVEQYRVPATGGLA